MVASGAKVGLWPFMVKHALDVLNRTTGPDTDLGGDSLQTAYELITGEQPKVMGIMPFGCRAYAVKPREAYSKTRIDTRAWVGYHLGRNSRSPGAYDVYIPSMSRIVTTSEVYFDESLMPLRPAGDQRVGAVVPVPSSSTVSDETAAAPAPWTKRKKISQSMVGASAQPMPPSANTISPK